MRRVIPLVVALLAFGVPSASPSPVWTAPGEPFASWNTAVEGDGQVLELSFDSPALGQRTTNLVYVPDVMLSDPAPVPVAYFLHGTVKIHGAAGQDINPYGTDQGPRGARGAVNALAFGETLGEQDFLIVAPDVGPVAWCPYCFWIDGHDGRGVAAETHLYDELIPLVEAMFRVRTDRAGRAIFGRSMGAGGALIQGFRHPDRFAFVGSLSGYVDVAHDPFLSQVLWAAYTRGQNYPLPPAADEIVFRNFSPVDLAPGVVGQNLDVVIVIGEGCIREAGRGDCAEHPATESFPAGAGQEIFLRANDDLHAATLAELGVQHLYVPREGIHGTINKDGYRRFMLERMNRVFAEHVPVPHRFSYKIADRTFSVWGWDVAVDRPNTEFLNVLGARTDGTEITFAGTGTATVLTPPGFTPGASYEVTVAPAYAEPVVSTVVADPDGRVAFTAQLGEPRTIDERSELVATGAFAFPHTRIVMEPSV